MTNLAHKLRNLWLQRQMTKVQTKKAGPWTAMKPNQPTPATSLLQLTLKKSLNSLRRTQQMIHRSMSILDILYMVLMRNLIRRIRKQVWSPNKLSKRMKVLLSSSTKTKPLELNRSSHSVSDTTSERSKQPSHLRNKTQLDWYNLTGNLKVVCSLSLQTELARRNKDHSDMVKSISRDLRESLTKTLPNSF